LPFQVNTTVTRRNISELSGIFKLAIDSGAASFHPFLLVPTGRGKEIADEVLPAVEYEKTLRWIYEKAQNSPIAIKPTCAPHYYRIARRSALTQDAPLTQHRSHHEHSPLDKTTKGCLGGQGFAFISHVGKVQICGFLPLEAGDLRQSEFDFGHIWRTSPLFREVRDVDHYHGKCGWCDFRNVCGGCRARAFASNGDHLGEEPCCLYRPVRNGVSV